MNIENLNVEKVADMVLDAFEKNKKYEITMMLTLEQLEQLTQFLRKFDKAAGYEEGK